MLLCAAVANAEPGTQPATAPSTQPVERALAPSTAPSDAVGESPATQPAQRTASGATTQPAVASTPTTGPTTRSIAQKFPTPAEIVERMKLQRAREDAKTKVAYLDLNEAIVEKPADFSFFGGDSGTTLRSLLSRLHKAQTDKDVRAVLVTLGAGSGMNLAQAQEVRDALVDLRRAGKKTFVYADSYDTIGYTVASGATDVCLLEGGELMIPGIGIETMFYKGTMDKLGVSADYIQIGEYKGAEEPYTRTEPSPELRAELTNLIDALYDQIVDGISLSRSMSTSAVREMIDDTMLSGRVAKERGFVDHLIDQDGLRALLKDELNNEVALLSEYGKPKREPLDFSNPFALLTALAKKPEVSDKPAVAIIYAEGVITDGDGEAGLFGGGGVGSESMRRTIRMAARDRDVKAIVLRIDSPGGSALASEVIWQALRRAAAEKPVIVSIGSMAASGGYYLASAGDYIFADPSAIVGSIGVVGGKFVMRDLFEKVGLTTQSFTKGRNADLFSSTSPWSDRQKRLVRTWMQQTYDQFTQRIMTTRSDRIKDIDKVARGRIFLAKQARELGMVDALGGLEAAIAYAADQASLKPGDYDVRMLPEPKTFADLLMGRDEEVAMPFRPTVTIASDSILHALAPAQRKLVMQQLQSLQLLQDRPVMLMSPYVITVK
jgi:protease-4